MKAVMIVAGIVVISCAACKRQEANDARLAALPDLSAMYRADKELIAALHVPPAPSFNVDKALLVRFKTEISILRDKVPYDARLAVFVPLIDKYDRIARLYELLGQTITITNEHIGCIKSHVVGEGWSPTRAVNACDPLADAKERTLAQGIRSGDIACNPVSGKEACDLPARIAELETEATSMYMGLTQSKKEIK